MSRSQTFRNLSRSFGLFLQRPESWIVGSPHIKYPLAPFFIIFSIIFDLVNVEDSSGYTYSRGLC